MKKMISRRNVLRGAGVAMFLPWLETFAPKQLRAQEVATPKRFVPIYMPGGAGIEWWDVVGSGKGTNWQLSTLLSPFAPLKEKMALIKNISSFTWRNDLLTTNNGQWDSLIDRADLGTKMPAAAYILPSHSRDPSSLLNCVDGDEFRRNAGQDVTGSPYNKETVDQLIAKSIGPMPVQSMQLGLVDGQGEFDGRHSAMSQNMSWSDTGTPLGKELNTQNVFDQLVNAGAVQQDSTTDPGAAEAAAKRKALDQSVLDSVQDSVSALQPRLATADRARLEEFLTGIGDIENSINQPTKPPSTAGCTPIASPGEVTDLNLKSGVMNALITMALQCDVTRVVSYMLDNSRSDMEYGHVPLRDFNNAGGAEIGGTAGGYHGSQHGGLRNNTFATISNWHVRNVADLATKLDAIQEGEGTVLDHTLILFYSDMHHGDHACWDLPIVLLGGGNGTFVRDEHVVLPGVDCLDGATGCDPKASLDNVRQMRDLHFTIMNAYFGMNVASFGDDMRGLPNSIIEEILA